MQIGVLKERRAGEMRVAATPDTVKKFLAAGCQVTVETGAGAGSQISDAMYQEAGATIAPTAAAAAASDVVLKIQKPMTGAEGLDEIGYLKSGSVLIAQLNALTSKERDAGARQPRCHDLRARANAPHQPRPVHGHPVLAVQSRRL